MLAGRIKLKHFLAIVIGVACAGVFLLVRACSHHETNAPKQLVEDMRAPAQTATTPPPATSPTSSPPGDAELAARAWDAEVLAWRTKSLSGGKGKDVSKGKVYKINVYMDAGHTTVNRAKVDVNRNDKWDEKYTFDGDTITLAIAPADDESYTTTYHWTGSAWRPEGATGPTQASTATGPTSTPEILPGAVALAARPYDAEAIAWKARSISGNTGKDVTKGKAYKINVYKDDGHTTVNRAKVDANRNDKWDDKYTFDGNTITLQRAPNDDEQYTETYHWIGTGWAKAP